MNHAPATIPVPRSLGTVGEAGEEPISVTDDLAYICTTMVNLYFVGPPGAGDRGWVLVDTGLAGSTERIVSAAANRFGPNSRPAAIILTHGHFDHVGAVRPLAELWDAPVYAHRMELPYLDGRSPYPPPDPTVGGGMMAALSFLYPRGPIDLGDRLHALPEDGSVPGLPGWRWVFTPGHSPGHVSLFRDEDRCLIAGDAFVTTQQESALAVMTQATGVHGPPAYFTPDWEASRTSVERLADLRPAIAATGHGLPLHGAEFQGALDELARNFSAIAVPPHGRYVGHPALTDADGIVSLPPDPTFPLRMAALGVAAGVSVAMLATWAARGRNRA